MALWLWLWLVSASLAAAATPLAWEPTRSTAPREPIWMAEAVVDETMPCDGRGEGACDPAQCEILLELWGPSQESAN